MINSYNYSKAIEKMCEQMELLSEIPNIYSDSYKEAIITCLSKEKEYCKASKSYGYIQFSCLVDIFREHGEIFDLVSNYIELEEGDEKKHNISTKIADSLVKSVSLYYREDIERDVETLYRRRGCGL